MTEPQPMPRLHYQPPRERLALLLEQLSEFDPEAEKWTKQEPLPEKKPESKLRFDVTPAQRPKLEAVPIRKTPPAADAVFAEFEKPEPMAPERAAAKSAPKPDQKGKAKKLASRKTAPGAKEKSQPKPKPLVKSKSKAKEAPSSFHEVLRSHARGRVWLSQQAQARQPRPESSMSPWVALTQRGLLGAVVRGWSWLNSKYKTSAAKRLRLSEVVQLGDKRFVALVKVEDREFLIGGGASGLSLLSPLDAPGGKVETRKKGIGSGGKSR